MIVSFDANILVYMLDPEAGERHAMAARIVADFALTGGAILSLQAASETANALRRKRVPPPTIRAAVGRLRDGFEIVPAQDDDLDDALWAVERHKLAFWDAMLWATCRRAGCSVLFTEDFQDGRTLKGLRFVNPFAPKNARYLPKA